MDLLPVAPIVEQPTVISSAVLFALLGDDGWLRFIRSEEQSLTLPGKIDKAVRKPSTQQFGQGANLVAVVSGSGTELIKVLLLETFLFTGTVKHYADDARLLDNFKKKKKKKKGVLQHILCSTGCVIPRRGAAFRSSVYTFKD